MQGWLPTLTRHTLLLTVDVARGVRGVNNRRTGGYSGISVQQDVTNRLTVAVVGLGGGIAETFDNLHCDTVQLCSLDLISIDADSKGALDGGVGWNPCSCNVNGRVGCIVAADHTLGESSVTACCFQGQVIRGVCGIVTVDEVEAVGDACT